jgi:hypothetical protein
MAVLSTALIGRLGGQTLLHVEPAVEVVLRSGDWAASLAADGSAASCVRTCPRDAGTRRGTIHALARTLG